MRQNDREFETATKVFAESYAEPGNNPNWREGMVSGNGRNGVVTSGAPYSDALIYQNIYFIMPSNHIRHSIPNLIDELQPTRKAILDNDAEAAKNALRDYRYFFYTFHPSHQLRLSMMPKAYSDYKRWTDYETAEVGVRYTDEDGKWERRTFTSRADDVTITEIKKSSDGAKINMTVSIDNPSSIYKWDFHSSDAQYMQYKKTVDVGADYIAQIAHYPGYENSELKDGGFAGLTYVLVIGGRKEKIELGGEKDAQNVGAETSPAVKISDADAVYLISKSERTPHMCAWHEFVSAARYPLVEELADYARKIAEKYMRGGDFDYDAALAAHTALHKTQFNKVRLDLKAQSADRSLSNEKLLAKQKENHTSLEPALAERAYYAGRYALLTSSGYMVPRLSGMWTGEWVPAWHGIYTMDANVNLQVSPMNTGNLPEASLGFIYFVLRQVADWMQNAADSFGMEEAIQVPVNTDGDRAVQIETDRRYPFQFWHAGASWMLLPVYEYWQCFGNQKIKLASGDIYNDLYDFDKITHVLGMEKGGLTEAEIREIKAKGYLELEKDILLPLLTKQANYWAQLCDPQYYTDIDGNMKHDPGKTQLNEREKYLLFPAYSPENWPGGSYDSTLTANAAMDIAAARDGLKMTIELEKAVNRKDKESAVAKWEKLLKDLPDYRYDGKEGEFTPDGGGGALCEWSVQNYAERNNHRHISHLYAAWPAYETQHDETVRKGARYALVNRDRLNVSDNTTGHGWVHRGLVSARLKNGEEVQSVLHTLLSGDTYYTSLMTDHNTNRICDAYCTDTSIGMAGVVNEALVFSDTKEIELLPALPPVWNNGSVCGLMTRTGAEIEQLSWNLEGGTVFVSIRANMERFITLTCGQEWKNATVSGGGDADIISSERIELHMLKDDTVRISFTV